MMSLLMTIREVFHFDDGRTIFVGNVEGSGYVASVECDLVVDGEPVQRVTLTEELPEKRGEVADRALSTSDRLIVADEVIRTRNCQFVEISAS
jgi:hypothetical protein